MAKTLVELKKIYFSFFMVKNGILCEKLKNCLFVQFMLKKCQNYGFFCESWFQILLTSVKNEFYSFKQKFPVLAKNFENK